jgi:hypothetical protein
MDLAFLICMIGLTTLLAAVAGVVWDGECTAALLDSDATGKRPGT